MSCLIAIDQSTSGTKALLFSLAGQIVDSETLEHQQHYPQPGWVEHDGEEIWQNLCRVVRSLLDRHPTLHGEVCGLTLTNQRETVLIFDRASGRPLCPAIVWQCRRSDSICHELRESGLGSSIESKTGLKLDAYFSASKLTWLMRERPELRKQLVDGDALIGNIDTYLIYRLTRRQVNATDHTNASRTLLFNLYDRTWDDDLCSFFDVPRRGLPEIRESFAQFGETDVDGILPHQVPICGVMGDSQASLFAQRCFTPGQTKATFGTGTSVMMNIGQELAAPRSGMVAALAWVHQGKPTYAFEGLINYSAATIAWLRDQLGLIASASESEELAASVSDSGGVYLVPAFSGMGAPYWNSSARAAIVGMSAYTKREHIVRAGLESIAYQIYDVLQSMGGGDVSPTRIRADGGPTRNRFLMQLVADISRLEVSAAEAPESSARGSAMAGLLGLGIADSMESLNDLPFETQEFIPSMDAADANKLTRGWHAAVNRIL